MSTMGPHENVFNYQRLMLRRDRVGGSQRDQAQRGRHHQLLQDLHQDSLPGATYSPNFLGRVILISSINHTLKELAEFMGLAKLVARTRDATLQMCWEGLLPRDNPRDTRSHISLPSDLASIVLCEGLLSTSSPVSALEESQKTSGICKIQVNTLNPA